MRKNLVKGASLALWMLSAPLSGCDLYYGLADPSVDASVADRPIDQADAVPDQLIADGSDVSAIDGQPFPPDALPDVVPDLFPMEDRFLDASPDEASTVDLPDGSDRADASDADDVPSELVDLMDGDAQEDVSDAPPDRFDEDFADVPADSIPSPDAPADTADAFGDASVDAEPIDGSDADVGSDDAVSDVMSDPPAPPDLVITYATTRGPTVIPADQDASRIDYSFGDGTSIACVTTRLASPLWRCTVPTVPPAARLVSALYFTIPGACGIGTGRSCDGWPTLWSVTWRGRTYNSETVVTTDAGSESAFRIAERTECSAQMGYNNTCVRLGIQP